MKTPKEFDYDLWTTKDSFGRTHYWVRLKHTVNVSEVSYEVMKFLRKEEKQLRRSIADQPVSGSVLSLDIPHDDEKSSWLEDHGEQMRNMQTAAEIAEFRASLTPKQRSVFDECIVIGKSVAEYGKEHGVSIDSVYSTRMWIRKKAKKYFSDGPKI